MLTTVPLWVLVFYYAIKLKIIKHPAFWFNIFVALGMIYFSYAELLVVKPDDWYFRLDESYFLRESKRSISEIIKQHQRYLLYILFSHATIQTAGEWALKIQSVPFAIISSLVIYDATQKKTALWLYPVFFSYIFFLSTLNMRDVLLISMTLFFALKLSILNRNALSFWIIAPIIFYFFIRPEMILIYAIALIWFFLQKIFKFRVTTTFIFPALLSVIILNSAITSQILYSIPGFFYEERIDVYLQERSEENRVIPFLTEDATALVRQLITPFPTSKIVQIAQGGSQNLYIYEILRMIMVSSFYFMVIYIICRPKRLLYSIQESDFVKIIFLIALLYTLSYALYSNGGGDSRNKVYPYLFFFIVFVSTFKIRFLKNHVKPILHRNSTHIQNTTEGQSVSKKLNGKNA